MGRQSTNALKPAAPTRRRAAAALIALGLLGGSATTSAQDFLKSLRDLGSAAADAVKGSKPAASAGNDGHAASPTEASPATPANAKRPAKSASDAATASLSNLKPNAAALNELRPDAQCLQVTEEFDVMKKAADYGGTAAQLRLEKLVETDFAQSDLSPADQEMLRYLAYTTIWVPAGVESSVGKAWAAFTSQGSDAPEPSGRSQRKALERQAARLVELRQSIDGFPGEPNLVLDPQLADGAFSRVGGLVVLSPRFLAMMDERDGVRDVLLAHELSHMYKRHAVKALQYQMVGSAKGWNVARRLLRQSISKSTANNSAAPFAGMIDGAKSLIENGKTVSDVVGFIKENQVGFSKTQELEADACALRWLTRLDIPPKDAWSAFASVLQDPGPDPGASYVALHPSPGERDQNIALYLKGPDSLPPTAAGSRSAQARARLGSAVDKLVKPSRAAASAP